MEKYQVYYFTRTGNSKRIADRLASRLSCEQYRISDDVDWKGLGAYLRFQAYAKGKKKLAITCEGNPSGAAETIVVSPIWGSRLTPAVQQFLARVSRDKVHIVTTSMMDALRGGDGYLSVTEIVRRNKDEDTQIDRLIDQLTNHV